MIHIDAIQENNRQSEGYSLRSHKRFDPKFRVFVDFLRSQVLVFGRSPIRLLYDEMMGDTFVCLFAIILNLFIMY